MRNHQKSDKPIKPIRKTGIGFSLFLTSACNLDNYHYCPGEICYIPDSSDTIIINEYNIDNSGLSGFTRTSTNVYVALDSSDHVLDLEGAYDGLDVTARGGDDIIDTGMGDDLIYGGAGYDIIRSHYGIDVVYGEGGGDHISGGGGDDHLFGGNGDDWLFGDSGHDFVHGGNNDDRIWGGSGSDVLYGDAGNDTFEIYEVHDSDLNDYFDGGTGTDKLRFYVEDPANPMYVDLSLIDADNIEILDLNNIDNQIVLELTIDDVIDVTDAFNELYIQGDTRDIVVSDGEGWVQLADEGFYHVYMSGSATLLIDQDIDQAIS